MTNRDTFSYLRKLNIKAYNVKFIQDNCGDDDDNDDDGHTERILYECLDFM